jgi:hypothetical protein
MVDTDRLAKDLKRALDQLQDERDELDNKIRVMENALRELGVKRGPGRPKGSKNKASAAGGGRRGPRKTPNWSPDARRAVSDRMKKYWAERRKKSAKKTKTKAKAKTA